jgi:hypothetical protein
MFLTACCLSSLLLLPIKPVWSRRKTLSLRPRTGSLKNDLKRSRPFSSRHLCSTTTFSKVLISQKSLKMIYWHLHQNVLTPAKVWSPNFYPSSQILTRSTSQCKAKSSNAWPKCASETRCMCKSFVKKSTRPVKQLARFRLISKHTTNFALQN